MVIYLYKIRFLFYKVILIICLFLFVMYGGYFLSYLRYSDYFIIDRESLLMENKILKSELSNIKNININYDNYVIGKVIIRDIHSFYDEVILNIGGDSVKVGDAVINNDGIIGVISKVDSNTSKVKLLSSNYNISVIVGNNYGNLNDGVITMLDKYSNVKVGDLVYTSGLGNISKGIYVGKVSKVYMDKDGLGKEALVSLVDNSNLNYVGILSDYS